MLEKYDYLSYSSHDDDALLLCLNFKLNVLLEDKLTFIFISHSCHFFMYAAEEKKLYHKLRLRIKD